RRDENPFYLTLASDVAEIKTFSNSLNEGAMVALRDIQNPPESAVYADTWDAGRVYSGKVIGTNRADKTIQIAFLGAYRDGMDQQLLRESQLEMSLDDPRLIGLRKGYRS